MSDRPALMGGRARFDELVPILRPNLPPFDDRIIREVEGLLRSGRLTKGSYLDEFESRVADYLGVHHAVGVSSCTMGLLLAYDGLGLSGEVIVPSFTFMATVHPLVWVGAEPVFADIDPETWCIDPRSVESLITDRTTAIVAVHNFGNPAAILELEEIAAANGLRLVFDSAHAFGSRYRGQPVGAFGDAEVFSFTPTKPVVAGEGGIVATNDERLARHIRLARDYGNPGDYGSEIPGLNARLPEFNALIALRSFDELENNIASRLETARLYRDLLGRTPGISFQSIREDDRSTFKDFAVTVDADRFGLSRDDLAIALRAENIDTRKYHYPPVHTHKPYRHLLPRFRSALSITDEVAAQSLSLPIWSRMEPDITDGVCEAIVAIHEHAGDIAMTLSNPTSGSLRVRSER